MAETIKSVIDGEMERFTPIDRQRLLDSDVYNQVISALNEPSARGAVSLPGEGDLSTSDLERRVEDERVTDVRAVVSRVINTTANKAHLG